MNRRDALSTLALSSWAGGRLLGGQIPDRVVALTFDDAAVSHATFVAPLLKKYGFGATFFVCEFPPDFMDKTKYMSWEQIRGLHEMGFEVGSHTRSHTHVTKMNRDQFVAELLTAVEGPALGLGLAVAPDRTAILYTKGSGNFANLYVIENFR